MNENIVNPTYITWC